MNVGFEALADHADGVADAVLAIENEFLRQDVENFAIFGKADIAGGFHGAADVFFLNVAGALAESDAAAAIYAANVSAGNADDRGFERHADDTFGFFYGAANGADGEIKIYDLAFAPAFRFGGAESEEFHRRRIFFLLGDERAGLRAADIERYDLAVFLVQLRAPEECKFFNAASLVFAVIAVSPWTSAWLWPLFCSELWPSLCFGRAWIHVAARRAEAKLLFLRRRLESGAAARLVAEASR